MQKFPSIESFANVYRNVVAGLTARPKIKLHGTNGGIRIEGGKAIAQSRNNVLVGTDNAGFAAWVSTQEDLWAKNRIEGTIFFGEWAGPGIQQNDAVTKIEKRAFFIFAVYYAEQDMMVTEPDAIRLILHPDLKDVYVLPWEGDRVTINYENAGTETTKINAAVEQIGLVDPYIQRVFGVEAPGEGLVYMPDHPCSLQDFSRSTFKAKTEAHRVKKSAKAVSTKIDVPTDAVDFVKTFLTEARLRQGLHEACDGSRDPKLTGAFLKWIGTDIHKESKVELEAMGYEWGMVAKFVIHEARTWFLAPELAEAA